MTFHDLKLHPSLLEGLEAINFTTPTPIQEQAIPHILEKKDVIASAQTGTGKTAAFLLPIIHSILESGHRKGIQVLIIVPTRELAAQIDQQIEGLSYFTSVSSIAIYGGSDGTSFMREKQALVQGVDLVVGTPGRLEAHLKMKYVNLENLRFMVLDEADRMLDMGFLADIMRIISFIPPKRQNLLFSATMPLKISELSMKILVNPVELNIAASKPVDRVQQRAFVLYDHQKLKVATSLLRTQKVQSAIIFCPTKFSVKQLASELKKAALETEEIHSDLSQQQREKTLSRFRNKELNILVATDLLSRGIDVEGVEMIVNYGVPNNADAYIHRVGRTARAARRGIAYTLIGEKEQSRFYEIEKLMGITVPKGKFPASFEKTPSYAPWIEKGNYRSKGHKKSY